MSEKRCPKCLSDSRKIGNMVPCQNAWHEAEQPVAPLPPVEVDDAFVEAVEDECGMGAGAWDAIDPKAICRAVLKLAAAAGVPSDGWVAVESALPKEVGEYLVWWHDVDDEPEDFFRSVGYFGGSEWHIEGGCLEPTVTHWREMPAAPQAQPEVKEGK